MSGYNFNEYREQAFKDEDELLLDDDNDVTMKVEDEHDEVENDVKPVVERKWYKHVYKSSCRQQKFRNFMSKQDYNENRGNQGGYKRNINRPFVIKKEFGDGQNDARQSIDCRSRIIDRYRRNTHLQKDSFAKMPNMYFPKNPVQKTFVVNINKKDGRQVQIQLSSEKGMF